MKPSRQPLRFLVIDDQAEDRGRLLHALRKGFSGAELLEIGAQQAFEEAVAHGFFDVVVAEYQLTWTDGLKMLKTIKKHAPHASVIWVSRVHLDEAIAAGMKAGLNDYVSKHHLHRLVKVIKESLKRSEIAREQVEALRQLQISEQRHRVISQLTSDYAYMLRIDADGAIVCEWANERFTAITGYTVEMLERQGGWTNFIHPEDVPAAVQRRQRWLAGETDVSEFRIMMPHGGERWVRDYTRPVHDSDSAPVIRVYGAGQDITERRRLEEPLRQAQKMEAIGRLAGSIAHDFNNLLQVISGYSDMLLRRLTRRNPLRQYVQEIKDVAEQGAILTRQLMTVSRKRLLQPQVLEFKGIVNRITPILQRILGEDIELRTVVDSTLGHVNTDPGQLEQVILNLTVNARDAMPQGGRLTLEAMNVELHETLTNLQAGIAPGEYIKLTVSDTGTGMDAETQSHIFEPFFTTKEPGKGTGLGLFTVYGIVNQNGGNMRVESAPGGGTTFTIYWPRVDTPAEVVEIESAPQISAHSGETILLVEDEAVVRDLVRKVLEVEGYMVLEAATGDQALQLANGHHGSIHLLLADVVLPGLSGPEVADRLTSTRPAIQVLFMSGYAQDTIERYGISVKECSFLQKPFTPTALLSRVRAVLDRSQGSPAGNTFTGS
jgi:two-component system cell cycle sensor histidine kinase/response regulator CckA